MKPNKHCDKCGHDYNSQKFPSCPNCKSKDDKSLDLNKDGKVDKKDASLAGRVLAAARKKRKKSRKKKS